MAGKTIYTGDMIASLESKIDSMVSSLGNTVTALGNQLTALNAINASVGQTVTAGITKASDAVMLTTTHTVKTALNTTTEVARVKLFVNGKVRIKVTVKTSSAGSGKVQYSIDGGATKVDFVTNLTTSYVVYSLDLNVKELDEVILYLNTPSAVTATAEANSMKVCFDLVNLVVDGYVVQS